MDFIKYSWATLFGKSILFVYQHVQNHRLRQWSVLSRVVWYFVKLNALKLPVLLSSVTTITRLKKRSWRFFSKPLTQRCQECWLQLLPVCARSVPYPIHCHDVNWKRPVKLRNLKPLSLFAFFFALARERIFIKTHSIESRCVTGPENILFAGASVLLSARKFDLLGQWRS